MHVLLVVARGIVVDDQLQSGHVQAPGGDASANQQVADAAP
jgi:hypothetical protein